MEKQTAWYGVADAAAYFGVSPNTIHRWVNQGKLPSSRTPGGRLQWRLAQLEAAMIRESQ